ncbi:MAG: rhodanese-like domain-containing protein [Gemmatimonadales bacterium]
MLLKRFYESKLAQASYLIGCPVSGEALVVDPNRDIDGYIQAANDEGLKIAHVTETHIHADFVSGARELSQRTGARLYLSDAGGKDWRYGYAGNSKATLLADGSRIEVGQVEIRVLHVPGHTPEHLAFLVTDTTTASEPMGMLTGDFLFVGDVGRPDLLERAALARGSMEESARQLFRSLQRIRALPEFLQIWPGHGAGSACGKALGAVPQSTLGYEKRFNWAFAVTDETSFVQAVLEGQPDPPRYFAEMKRLNREGPRLLGEIRRPPRLLLAELERALNDGAAVVDPRPALEYGRAAVPGTLNIPGNRSFTTWAGWLLPYDQDFYLIIDEGSGHTVDQLRKDLAGIGLDRVAGYFGGEVVDAWRASHGQLQTIASLDLADFAAQVQSNEKIVLDVRGEGEWNAGHIPGSINLPVGDLEARMGELPRHRPLIVHCQTGARAAIAASLLRARGFPDVRQFPGGFAEWRAAGKPVEEGG